MFRENTEGIYVNVGGQFKRGTPDEIAINEDINTRKGVERLIVAGFEYAKRHGAKSVHLADKSNAMRHAHELWYRCFFEVAKRYPGIAAHHDDGSLGHRFGNVHLRDGGPGTVSSVRGCIFGNSNGPLMKHKLSSWGGQTRPTSYTASNVGARSASGTRNVGGHR